MIILANLGANAQETGLFGVIACWFVFVVAFALRKRLPRPTESKRDRTAITGMILQGAGYFLVWFQLLARKQFVPVTLSSPVIEWGLAILAVVIAAASTWLVDAASRQLGKQWALSARLVEGHDLIQNGPYRYVRNPIYLGMFGMLLATGLVRTGWIALLVACLLFFAGTYIRVRSEERLLREAFGVDFDAYTKKVPALIPGIY